MVFFRVRYVHDGGDETRRSLRVRLRCRRPGQADVSSGMTSQIIRVQLFRVCITVTSYFLLYSAANNNGLSVPTVFTARRHDTLEPQQTFSGAWNSETLNNFIDIQPLTLFVSASFSFFVSASFSFFVSAAFSLLFRAHGWAEIILHIFLQSLHTLCAFSLN